jgi:hypothetical protein
MNQNATVPLITRTTSFTNVVNSVECSQYDELSSSGVESDWILFSPFEEDEEEGDIRGADVLSSSNADIGDDESEDDSLIDTLGSANPSLNLNLGSLAGTLEDDIEDEYITNRIEHWRKQQARELISTLHRTSDTSELLASWGVDDRLMIEPDYADQKKEEQDTKTSKRYYGDDIMQHYSSWEVNKIKKVARQLSSSLVRDPPPSPLTMTDIIRRPRSHRTSLLLNLSRSANRYFSQYSANQPFWKQDLSSAHSSLSLSTNSIMFGNLSLGA